MDSINTIHILFIKKLIMRIYWTCVISAKRAAEINSLQERESLLRSNRSIDIKKCTMKKKVV